MVSKLISTIKMLEDLASSICSDDSNKRTMNENIIHCYLNPREITMNYKRLANHNLFSVVNSAHIIISELLSQLCGLWRIMNSSDDLFPDICQSILWMLPVAKSLPVQPDASCHPECRSMLRMKIQLKKFRNITEI